MREGEREGQRIKTQREGGGHQTDRVNSNENRGNHTRRAREKERKTVIHKQGDTGINTELETSPLSPLPPPPLFPPTSHTATFCAQFPAKHNSTGFASTHLEPCGEHVTVDHLGLRAVCRDDKGRFGGKIILMRKLGKNSNFNANGRLGK